MGLWHLNSVLATVVPSPNRTSSFFLRYASRTIDYQFYLLRYWSLWLSYFIKLTQGKVYLLLLGTTALSLVTTPLVFKLVPAVLNLGVLMHWFPSENIIQSEVSVSVSVSVIQSVLWLGRDWFIIIYFHFPFLLLCAGENINDWST